MRSLVSKDGEFTPEEATRFTECRNALEATNSEIETTKEADLECAAPEVEETRASNNTFQIHNKMENTFSLGGTLRSLVEGKQVDGFAKEVMQESRNRAASAGIHATGDITFDPSVYAEMRAAGDFQADSATAGEAAGGFVGVGVAGGTYSLRPKSIFDKLNVTRLSGLRGDLNLPVGAASVAATEGEVDAASQSASSITANTLTPQRIAAMLTVSGQLMKQSDVNIDAFLMGDLMRAIGSAQDSYFYAQLIAGFVEVNATANGQAITTHAGLLAQMEADLDGAGANRDAAQIVIHPDAFAAFRTQAMVSGVNALTDARNIIGYDTAISSNAVDGSSNAMVVMGDFSDFVIGEWGGLDLKVDTYTNAHLDQVRLIANTHVDATVRQAGNFSGYTNADGTPANA